MIPGSNLLRMALTVIAKQSFVYYRAKSRSTNSIGLYVSVYNDPITLSGSVQPVPRQLYQAYGLEFQKSYVTFFLSKNAIDVSRDVSGDKMVFDNKTYQCLSKTDWFGQDGWDELLTVEVPS